MDSKKQIYHLTGYLNSNRVVPQLELRDLTLKQILDKNLSGMKGDDFFSTEGYVKLFPTNELNFTVGINYASNSSNSFLLRSDLSSSNLIKLILSAEFNPM